MQHAATIPAYLHDTYWWAYEHPNAVKLFERQWLVNLILWGNFARLRDAALDSLGDKPEGRTLQVACVYGDFTTKLSDFTANLSDFTARCSELIEHAFLKCARRQIFCRLFVHR